MLFRLGDFYEMFLEDAEVASRELEIVLTSREAGKDQRIPMCGIPFHAANSYIGRLIDKGYKVAICEQVEDPKTAKGLVKREVVRVITPGTLLDDQMLQEKDNNFIAALYRTGGNLGWAVADLSTGEFWATQFPAANRQLFLDELQRWRPRELLLPEGEEADMGSFQTVLTRRSPSLFHFDRANARRSLRRRCPPRLPPGNAAFGLGAHDPAFHLFPLGLCLYGYSNPAQHGTYPQHPGRGHERQPARGD